MCWLLIAFRALRVGEIRGWNSTSCFVKLSLFCDRSLHHRLGQPQSGASCNVWQLWLVGGMLGSALWVLQLFEFCPFRDSVETVKMSSLPGGSIRADTLLSLAQMRSSFTCSHTHVMMNSFFLHMFISGKVQVWAKFRQDSLSGNDYKETFSPSKGNCYRSIHGLYLNGFLLSILVFCPLPWFYNSIRSLPAVCDCSL